MKRAGPRPICPECGSADVVVGDKTGSCNRCGEMFQSKKFFDYPGGPQEGMQRSSLDDVEARSRGDDDWMAVEARRGARR